MALAHARRSQEDEVLFALDERAARELPHLFAADRGLETEVEVLQGAHKREGGGLHDHLRGPRVGGFGFASKDPLQELGVALVVLSGLLGQKRRDIGHRVQVQATGVKGDPFQLEVHESTSS